MTTDNLRTIRKELLPRYQDMAYQRYNEQLNNSFKRLEVLKSLDNSDYDRYKNFVLLSMETAEKISKNTYETAKDNMSLMQNALTNQMTINKMDADAQAEAYKNAWLKFKEIGYVDNEISLVTGLPVGTKSKEAEQEIMARYDEYNKIAIATQQRKEEQELQFEMIEIANELFYIIKNH
jgi:hypothetical protein